VARFIFDHDVSSDIAIHLHFLGHDVVTARTIRQEKATDYQHLLFAAEQTRILVSHNEKHFVLLHGAWHVWSQAWNVTPQHSGILIIPHRKPLVPRWQPASAAQELAQFVDSHPTLSSQAYAWREGAGWTLIQP
jgi:hypothetical protein